MIMLVHTLVTYSGILCTLPWVLATLETVECLSKHA